MTNEEVDAVIQAIADARIFVKRFTVGLALWASI